MLDENKLAAISRLVRYYILTGTTAAGSGHPSSSLSAVELMTALMFGGFFNFDLDNPENSDNDRLIFSKGHAAPLLYALAPKGEQVGRASDAGVSVYRGRNRLAWPGAFDRGRDGDGRQIGSKIVLYIRFNGRQRDGRRFGLGSDRNSRALST